jgi:hypothetical protein
MAFLLTLSLAVHPAEMCAGFLAIFMACRPQNYGPG